MLELIDEGIIEKQGFKYKLSKNWLNEINSFTKETLNNYKFGMRNNLLNKNTTQIHLYSLYEMGHFMLEALESRFLENKHKDGFVCILNHLWIPFADREKHKRLFALQDKLNIVYTKNNFVDKILYNLCYKKNVYKIKYLNKELDCDIFVYNNCIFQIYMSKKLRNLMDKLYSSRGNPFKMVSNLFAMTYGKQNINIIITRNKELAKEYRENILNNLS